MNAFVTLSDAILLIAMGTLIWVAAADFRQFRIRNELVLVLAALYFLNALVMGRWSDMPEHMIVAALAFVAMLYAYSQRLMGGGDVKLLAVAFLWTGIWYASPFIVLLMAFAGLHLVGVRLGWASVQGDAGGQRIPLAPAVAAALVCIFVLSRIVPLP